MIDLSALTIPQYAISKPIDFLANPPIIHKFNGLTGFFYVGSRSVGNTLRMEVLSYRLSSDGILQILFREKISNLLSLLNLRKDNATNVYCYFAAIERSGALVCALEMTLESKKVTVHLIDDLTFQPFEETFFACDVDRFTFKSMETTLLDREISDRVDWKLYPEPNYDFE